MINERPTQIVLVVFFLAMIVLVGSMFVFNPSIFTTDNTPKGVFNNHIQALADQEWELAHSYLADDCEITLEEVERTFEFQSINTDDWRVDKEFIEDDEALLWFDGRGLQYMLKEDGDWKISCGGDFE